MNGYIGVDCNIKGTTTTYGWLQRELQSYVGPSFKAYGCWCIETDETETNEYIGIIVPIYRPITEIPIFTGDWKIDEENSNEGGKQYLSNVIIDK